MSNNTPLEYDECVTLVDYLELRGIKYSHINQEMYTTSWKQKNKAKALGVHPGVPDYIMIINDQLVFIEMKRQKGGRVSETQKEWIEALRKAGVNVHICYGFDQAKGVIDKYF